MDIIKITPIKLWGKDGVIQANCIKFLPSTYSFSKGTLEVNYQLLGSTEIDGTTTYEYISGGSCTVHQEDVENWGSDSFIYDYVIAKLGLEKN